jgi:predicted RNA-binding protein with TRAM domain
MAEQVWVKSSYSGSEANCVEVGCGEPGVVAVRDSKDPGGPVLRFEPAGWVVFTSGVKAGMFDLGVSRPSGRW